MHNHTIKATVKIVKDFDKPQSFFGDSVKQNIVMDITIKNHGKTVEFNAIQIGHYFMYEDRLFTKIRQAPHKTNDGTSSLDFGCAINTKVGAAVGFWGDSLVRPAIVTHMTVEV